MQLGHELIVRKEGAPNTNWRVEQLEYLLRDHDAMLADREAEIIIRRVPLFCDVVWDCLELFPTKHEYWMSKAIQFFACANDVYDPVLVSLGQESPADISTMLVKRKVLGQQHSRAVYSRIVKLFFKKGWNV